MAKGIYITPEKFVSFEEARNLSSLKQEIASRSAAYDFTELVGLLPDPDPILAKRGDGVEILETLSSDPHLISVMQSRKLGVLKQEFKFDPGVDESDKPTSQSEALCQDFKKDMAELGSRDLISSILDAPYYGMTPIELTFEPVEGRLRLKKLEAKPVRWFGFDTDNEPRFRSLDEPEDGDKLPWGKFVFARHFPTYDNPYGLRLLSRCFWPITFKKGGLKFWVTFMEKYGMPFLLGHYSRGTSPDEQQAMLDKLERMVRNAVAVVPDGDRIEMLGGSGKTGGGYMVFDKMRKAMDDEISKVIQGQTLTTEAGDKGSRALGQVHNEVLSTFQESDKLLAKTALDEIAKIYAQANGDDVPPPVCTFFEAEDPQKDFAERDKILEEGSGGRLRLSKSYYVRRYGYQENDFELVAETAAGDLGKGEPVDHSEDSQTVAAAGAMDHLDDSVAAYVQDGADILAGFKKMIRRWTKGHKTIESGLADIGGLGTRLSKTDGTELADSLLAAMLEGERLGSSSIKDEDFAEAEWGAGKPFKKAIDYFRAKAFLVSGITRAMVLELIKNELLAVMEADGDINSFRDKIDTIFIAGGLDTMAAHHIETLYRTNMHAAFQAGRYNQLTKPHILKARPYWKYIAIRDGSTRPAHAEMNGKVFHHTNPIWQVWYPPNGFNCRCQVVSLSEREVKRDGYGVEKKDLAGTTFEHLDKETGRITKHVLLPDEGWHGNESELERLTRQLREKEENL